MDEPIEAWAVTSDGGLVLMEHPWIGAPQAFELMATRTFTVVGILVFYSSGRMQALRGQEATVTSGDTLTYTLHEAAWPVVYFNPK